MHVVLLRAIVLVTTVFWSSTYCGRVLGVLEGEILGTPSRLTVRFEKESCNAHALAANLARLQGGWLGQALASVKACRQTDPVASSSVVTTCKSCSAQGSPFDGCRGGWA